MDFKVSIQDMEEDELLGDVMRMSQILINLLSNAVKFTPDHGLFQSFEQENGNDGTGLGMPITKTWWACRAARSW